MEPDVIADLIEAAERYYDATFDLNEAEKLQRDVDRSADANPHEIAHAEEIQRLRLVAERMREALRAETLRAAGALLRAVETYREANK